VTFAVPGQGSIGPVTDNGNGTYTATYTAGTVPGVQTLTASLGGVAIVNTATVTLIAGAASIAQSTVEATSPVVADGVTTSTITVTVKDANGNVVQGQDVYLEFEVDGSVTGGLLIGETGSDGVRTSEAASEVAMSMLVRAYLGTDAVGTPITQTATVQFTKDVAGLTVDPIASRVFTGSAIEPAVTVEDDGLTLVLGVDYTVAYTDNVNVGTATVTITGAGNYTGTRTVQFTISAVPAPPAPPAPSAPSAPPAPEASESVTTVTVIPPTVRLGSSGATVELLQRLLNEQTSSALSVDGIFGTLTDRAVRAYQRANGLLVDGIVGPQTWTALLQDQPALAPPVVDPSVAAPAVPDAVRETVRRGDTGSDVAEVQRRLNIAVDGIFGPITESAVREFQRSSGLAVDGIVGPLTWAALGN